MTNAIHPKEISACELPICYRARRHYTNLWCISNAYDFCKQLIQLAAVPSITIQEYAAVAAVARGEMWPVPDRMYTRADWERDRNLNAAAGQEIDPEIYEEMFNVLPPLRLPRNNRRVLDYDCGFLCSEPHTSDPIKAEMLYMAFGKREGRCYYIGLIPSDAR